MVNVPFTQWGPKLIVPYGQSWAATPTIAGFMPFQALAGPGVPIPLRKHCALPHSRHLGSTPDPYSYMSGNFLVSL